jgi:hypothetical protein
MLSNIYYYEITITFNKNIDSFDENEYINIGFGNKDITYRTYLGAHNSDSISYSSYGLIKSGFIKDKNNYKKNPMSSSWKPGDTIGAGIIYISYNKIKVFFTLNGKLIYKTNKPIEIYESYFPMINYNYSYSISVNFSTEKFLFDIKDFILIYSKNILSTDNSFIENYDVNLYMNNVPKKKYISQLIYDLISPLMTNNLTNTQELNNNTSQLSPLFIIPISSEINFQNSNNSIFNFVIPNDNLYNFNMLLASQNILTNNNLLSNLTNNTILSNLTDNSVLSNLTDNTSLTIITNNTSFN